MVIRGLSPKVIFADLHSEHGLLISCSPMVLRRHQRSAGDGVVIHRTTPHAQARAIAPRPKSGASRSPCLECTDAPLGIRQRNRAVHGIAPEMMQL